MAAIRMIKVAQLVGLTSAIIAIGLFLGLAVVNSAVFLFTYPQPQSTEIIEIPMIIISIIILSIFVAIISTIIWVILRVGEYRDMRKKIEK